MAYAQRLYARVWCCNKFRCQTAKSGEKIVDVDAVIITHIHPDHWDEFAEKALDKNIKVFVQSNIDKDYVISKGFTNVEIIQESGIEYNAITLYKTGTQQER